MPMGKSAAAVKAELQRVLASELAARKFSYPRSDGSQWTLALKDVVERAADLEMAYNPNDCVELRWGARARSEEALDLQAAGAVGAARQDDQVPRLVQRAAPSAARLAVCGRVQILTMQFYFLDLLLIASRYALCGAISRCGPATPRHAAALVAKLFAGRLRFLRKGRRRHGYEADRESDQKRFRHWLPIFFLPGLQCSAIAPAKKRPGITAGPFAWQGHPAAPRVSARS